MIIWVILSTMVILQHIECIFCLCVRILTKLQFDKIHKIGRKSNMCLYTHGGLIRCKSLLLAFIFLVFLFSIVIFMLWQYTWNIEPQTRAIYKLIEIWAQMVACSASPCSTMFFVDQGSSNLFFISMSKSCWPSLSTVLCKILFSLLANCYCILLSLSLIIVSFLDNFYYKAIK